MPILIMAALTLPLVNSADAPADARRGYELMVNRAYVPGYFDQEVFDNVWRVWPKPLRQQAEQADAEKRRQMAFRRYGLTGRADDPTKPLQFVVDQKGVWSPNCFTCHGGEVLGKAYPGAPNNRYALKTLIEETRAAKSLIDKEWSPLDYNSIIFELGSTHGTTNAVIFGVALGDRRDEDLNIIKPKKLPRYVHHDMDAPPWWHAHRKDRLYIDGFAEKTHRAIMQFALDLANDADQVKAWEDDYRHIMAYIESVRAPKYPFSIDRNLANRGRKVFLQNCASCHGDSENHEYPAELVSISDIGTDQARNEALTPAHRDSYRRNWLGSYGKADTVTDPDGYMAPPLNGVWASAPYLHNGSVPTLWHLLNPSKRPTVWKRTGEFDQQRVGLPVDTWDKLPKGTRRGWDRRSYFDTSKFGKSNAGHLFPDELTDDEKTAVLEYLKTL